MSNEILEKQAKAQAIYMQYLLEKASLKTAPPAKLAFDPQGRVITDVTLNESDYSNITALIKQALPQSEFSTTNNQELIEKALGRKITPATTISLDISATTISLDISDSEQYIHYNTQLDAALQEVGVTEPTKRVEIQEALSKQPKDSIIALQQEFHFHLALTSRVYQKIAAEKFSNVKPEQMQAAHQAAMHRVNNLVMQAFAKGLKEATKDGHLDISILNKVLDKARKEIAPRAHEFLQEEIVRHTGIVLTASDLKEAGDNLKHTAEVTTATPNDMLHTSSGQGLVTFIGGSDVTAHDRGLNKIADRQIITHIYAGPGKVEANKNPRIQIRTPSLDFKKEKDGKKKVSAEDSIADIAQKLNIIRDGYGLPEKLSGGGLDQKPKAFIYNLYTALNDTLGDTGGNLQTQGAERIFKGVHAYNASQLDLEGKLLPNGVLCFAQNISVNGFGSSLNYNSRNPLTRALTKEATLMAEMAMLHSLYDGSTPSQQAKIRDIFQKYTAYLANPNRKEYFSQSQEGNEAIAGIQAIKEGWKKDVDMLPEEDVVINTKNALRQLMANNMHFDKKYAKLIQTLSVFSAEASIGGCKSGNERAQSINGRVAMLDILLAHPEKLGKDKEPFQSALRDLAAGREVEKNAAALNDVLHRAYNNKGLQAAASLVSLADQGASAKVEAKSKENHISRNYGEEHAKVMTNLSQTKAGDMQAHKGLTKYMKSTVAGSPRSGWEILKAKHGTLGAGLRAVFSLGIAVAVASKQERNRAKNDLAMKQTELLEEHRANTRAPTPASSVAPSSVSVAHSAEPVADFHHTPQASRPSSVHSSSVTSPRQVDGNFREAMAKGRENAADHLQHEQQEDKHVLPQSPTIH